MDSSTGGIDLKYWYLYQCWPVLDQYPNAQYHPALIDSKQSKALLLPDRGSHQRKCSLYLNTELEVLVQSGGLDNLVQKQSWKSAMI